MSTGSVEVIGIDHIYVAVRDLRRSEEFYDRVMDALGYRKRTSMIAADPHVHYFNRQFGFSLRPARHGTPDHNPYAPGLHHFCFRVVDERTVRTIALDMDLGFRRIAYMGYGHQRGMIRY